MPVDRDTANKQWEICPRCGKKKTFEDAPSGRCPDSAKDAEAMVPMGDLEHGAYYFGTCRNAQVARWNADTQRFVYVRVKFNEVFPEEIGYWIDAKPGEKRFDEFRPYGKVENPPFEIPMRAEGREWDRYSTVKGKIRARNDRPLKGETKVFKFDRLPRALVD